MHGASLQSRQLYPTLALYSHVARRARTRTGEHRCHPLKNRLRAARKKVRRPQKLPVGPSYQRLPRIPKFHLRRHLQSSGYLSTLRSYRKFRSFRKFPSTPRYPRQNSNAQAPTVRPAPKSARGPNGTGLLFVVNPEARKALLRSDSRRVMYHLTSGPAPEPLLPGGGARSLPQTQLHILTVERVAFQRTQSIYTGPGRIIHSVIVIFLRIRRGGGKGIRVPTAVGQLAPQDSGHYQAKAFVAVIAEPEPLVENRECGDQPVVGAGVAALFHPMEKANGLSCEAIGSLPVRQLLIWQTVIESHAVCQVDYEGVHVESIAAARRYAFESLNGFLIEGSEV